MTMLRIEEWQNRYHPGLFGEAALEQFDKVRNLVMEQALENAMQTLNLKDRELICIREIQVPVYLRLSGTLQSQAACWSLAIVKQIQQQSNSKNGQSIVRYRSRGHAWVSCAEAVLKGEFSESWAWKQIGMITIDTTDSPELALSKLFAALINEPGYLLPVLNAVCADNLFASLLLSTCDSHWRKVQEILQESFKTRFTEIFSDRDELDCSLEAINFLLNNSQSMEATAKLQIIGSLASVRHLNLQSRQTIVLVVLALSDPGILCRSAEIVGEKLKTLLQRQQHTSLPEIDKPIKTVSLPGKEPLADVSQDQELVSKKSTNPELHQNIKQEGFEQLDNALDDNHQYSSEEHSTMPAQSGEDTSQQINRAKTVTRFGGLLYLLNLLEHPCGLVDIFAQSYCFNQRSMIWVWLHLAITIIPAELDDPAVLAFAGLIPGKPLDKELWLSPTDAEQQQVEKYASQIITATQDRLEIAGSDLSVNMDCLYQRRAIITSDPGWFEVEFSLNDVDTGIRRAGLDIDPGFLPWLAVVMRFKYA